jgi:hypothetical protein
MKSEPVVSAQVLAGLVQVAIMAGLGMAVSLGWVALDSSQMGSIETFVKAALALLALIAPQIVAALWARAQVTPVANPKTAAGDPALLVPKALMTPQMAAQVADYEYSQSKERPFA